MFPCPFCPRVFKTSRAVGTHKRYRHPGLVQEFCVDCSVKLTEDNQRASDKKEGKSICKLCKAKRRKYHIEIDPKRYYRYDEKSREKRDTEKQISLGLPPRPIRYMCHGCERGFRTERGLAIHIRKFHAEIPQGCCCHCLSRLTANNQRENERNSGINICRDCINLDKAKWVERNPEAKSRHSKNDFDNETPERRKRRLNRQSKAGLKQRLIVRAQVLFAYGGQCSCCGESNPEFLVVDHIFADPDIDEKGRRLGGIRLYLYIISLGFPKDRYRLLCHNCNASIAFYGYCPHQTQIDLFPTWAIIKRVLKASETRKNRSTLSPPD